MEGTKNFRVEAPTSGVWCTKNLPGAGDGVSKHVLGANRLQNELPVAIFGANEAPQGEEPKSGRFRAQIFPKKQISGFRNL